MLDVAYHQITLELSPSQKVQQIGRVLDLFVVVVVLLGQTHPGPAQGISELSGCLGPPWPQIGRAHV